MIGTLFYLFYFINVLFIDKMNKEVGWKEPTYLKIIKVSVLFYVLFSIVFYRSNNLQSKYSFVLIVYLLFYIIERSSSLLYDLEIPKVIIKMFMFIEIIISLVFIVISIMLIIS